VSAAVLVVLALVTAGALLGPVGMALGLTALAMTLLGMVLHDLPRSGAQR
jgi:hypothetical protein